MCRNFSVSVTKEVKMNGKEFTKTMSYKSQFNGTARFVASSLSNYDNDLLKEFRVKEDLIVCKFVCCSSIYKETLDGNLKKNYFVIHSKFLAMASINYFVAKKVFINHNCVKTQVHFERNTDN